MQIATAIDVKDSLGPSIDGFLVFVDFV